MNTFTAIIPARYASTRFPGKPLAMLGDKPIIQHVVERAAGSFDRVYVATDDERIARAVTGFGGHAVMTGTHHLNGTTRLAQAAALLGLADDTVVVNIQGDEPFITAGQLQALKEAFDNPVTHIATLARPLVAHRDDPGVTDPNTVKAVCRPDGMALYFSRSPIPYVRDNTATARYLLHVGLYGYRTATLRRLAAMASTPLESAESLEQLRWLENGFNIHVGLTNDHGVGIDTPADLERARQILNGNHV